jgi:hypothetical protein
MDVASFAEIATEFRRRIEHTIWCTMTTVDTRGRCSFEAAERGLAPAPDEAAGDNSWRRGRSRYQSRGDGEATRAYLRDDATRRPACSVDDGAPGPRR